METILLIVVFAAQMSWTIYQLEVQLAFFFHGKLSNSFFVEQPSGYVW